jgi:hypothetical protein
MSGQIKIKDRKNDAVAIVDPVSASLVNINWEHKEIHDGHSFFCRNFNDIPNGGDYEILIVTPNASETTHLIYEFFNESEIQYQIYEGTVTSDNGTAVDCFNRDRNSTNTPGTLVFHTPTITNDGTELANTQVGTRTLGGESRTIEEIILKVNTKYLIRATNQTSGFTNLFNFLFTWYEHKPSY